MATLPASWTSHDETAEPLGPRAQSRGVTTGLDGRPAHGRSDVVIIGGRVGREQNRGISSTELRVWISNASHLMEHQDTTTATSIGAGPGCERHEAQLQELELANSVLSRQAALATERTRVLIDVMRAFAQELELDPLLATIMGSVTQVMHADRSTLFLVDSQTNELWSRVAQGDGVKEIRIPDGAGIVGHVTTTGEVVNIADAYDDPRFEQEVDRATGYRTRSILCVPMRDEHGQVVGAIQCLNKQDGVFTVEDKELLEALAAQAHIALRVAHEVQIRETRLRQQMAALQIQIDVQKGQREVSEITNSDYFQRLQDLGAEHRRRAGRREIAGSR